MCWCEKGRVLPGILWCWWRICPSRKAGQLWVSRLLGLTLPYFLWAPSPYGLYDQLQTTLFPKNKHAYGIGGSFVAIKGNNRVFKKITLHFK